MAFFYPRHFADLPILWGDDGIISQVKPVVDELSILTPEELGMDKPELFIPDPACWWEKKWYADYALDKKEGYRHFAT